MTTTVVETNRRQAAWTRAGTAVEANSAADVIRQTGLDWSVSLATLQAQQWYTTETDMGIEVNTRMLPVETKQAVLKTKPDGTTTVIGVVGNEYKVFQNAEVFGTLDSLIDSGEARYAAAGELNGGARVWMLMELPTEVNVANDPHAAFLLAKTSHDGSSSVIIKPIIERLYCMNQINKIYRGKNNYTYTLTHSTNSMLSVSDIRNIVQLSYDMAEDYTNLANTLMGKEVSRASALAYFKKVFPLPSKIEESPYESLSLAEKRARSFAERSRSIAYNIYGSSDTQENIRGTEFGLWQAVVEYADYNTNSKNKAVASMSGFSDPLKLRALELLTV